MSFDAIPEDKEQSFPCESTVVVQISPGVQATVICKGHITQNKDKSYLWECCDCGRKEYDEVDSD